MPFFRNGAILSTKISTNVTLIVEIVDRAFDTSTTVRGAVGVSSTRILNDTATNGCIDER